MTKHRRWLSMLLAFAMVISMFGMLPASFVYAAGPSLTAEVEGYIYGPTSYWTPGTAKSLNVSVDIPHVTAGEEYKLRIKTQRGLSLVAFPYDGTKPSNVPGATVALTSGEQTAIIANSVYYDDGGTPATNDTTQYGDDYTVLTYTISGGTSHLAFSAGRIQIQTDEQGQYSYPGLDKPNAIVVELLDKSDNVVLTETLG